MLIGYRLAQVSAAVFPLLAAPWVSLLQPPTLHPSNTFINPFLFLSLHISSSFTMRSYTELNSSFSSVGTMAGPKVIRGTAQNSQSQRSRQASTPEREDHHQNDLGDPSDDEPLIQTGQNTRETDILARSGSGGHNKRRKVIQSDGEESDNDVTHDTPPQKKRVSYLVLRVSPDRILTKPSPASSRQVYPQPQVPTRYKGQGIYTFEQCVPLIKSPIDQASAEVVNA
jgi:hypothetical protein